VTVITAFVRTARHKLPSSSVWRECHELQEAVMTKVHHGIFGALALLASVLPATAFAGYKPTAAQMSACRGDAFRLCAGQLTSFDAVAACLLSKKSELSPGCLATYPGEGKSAAK
jgi:hypothetical protein